MGVNIGVERAQKSDSLDTVRSLKTGLMVVGALISTVVKANIGLTFTQGDLTMTGNEEEQQTLYETGHLLCRKGLYGSFVIYRLEADSSFINMSTSAAIRLPQQNQMDLSPRTFPALSPRTAPATKTAIKK